MCCGGTYECDLAVCSALIASLVVRGVALWYWGGSFENESLMEKGSLVVYDVVACCTPVVAGDDTVYPKS